MTTFGILFIAGLGIGAVSAGAQEGLLSPARGGATPPPVYFPLEVGNSWVYQGGGVYAGTNLTLEITRTSDFGGQRYVLLHGLPQGDYWLRRDETGSVVAYDPVQATEKLWWSFGAPEGQVYLTYLPGACCGTGSTGARAVVSSHNFHYKGPVGEFNQALEIVYPDVFQIGIQREVFLPGIGLAFRDQATGGPSYGSWELIYAFVGGARIPAGPEFGFSVFLDKAIYTANMMPPVDPNFATPVMTARISLRNTAQPITLTYPTSQVFDFTIRNERGDVVYRWSDGRAFAQVVRTEVFGPGEKNIVLQVRLAGADKNPLPPGKYIARGWLTTMAPAVYDSSVTFEIRWVQ